MNILTETNRKLEYNIKRFNDLNSCLDCELSIDAIRFVNDEINKTNSNIKYYSELISLIKK